MQVEVMWVKNNVATLSCNHFICMKPSGMKTLPKMSSLFLYEMGVTHGKRQIKIHSSLLWIDKSDHLNEESIVKITITPFPSTQKYAATLQTLVVWRLSCEIKQHNLESSLSQSWGPATLPHESDTPAEQEPKQMEKNYRGAARVMMWNKNHLNLKTLNKEIREKCQRKQMCWCWRSQQLDFHKSVGGGNGESRNS